jgi:antirestriction protein
MSEPKVYMACLSSYNDGVLRGAWRDADELQRGWRHPGAWKNSTLTTAWKSTLTTEWAIHDYDGVPNMGENPDIDFLIEAMRCIEEHGDAFFRWFEQDSWNMSHLKGELSEKFQEQYRGEYDSPKAFAEEFAAEVGWLSNNNNNPLFRYVDFDWYWHADLRHSFTYSHGHVWCCE